VVELACPRCLAINQVPRDGLPGDPACAFCAAPLLPGEPVAVTAASFDSFIRHSGLPVLVEFSADDCGPCRMMAPILDAVAAELKTRLRVAWLDAETHPQVPMRHHIRGVPALLLFRDAAEIARHTGAMEAHALKRWLEAQGV